jgi:nitroimidazol reductase NimA-like FMN-containing flavoprotein (pyridoxamine 5'-phosphate oxidase superfamily)
MAIKLSGPWQQQQVDSFLSDAKLPVRLSCVASDGFPRVISLWFLYRSNKLYCVTHQSSKLVRMLQQNPRVGFEVAPDAPPYRGVRGQGMAAMQPLGKDPALRQLLERYVGDTESGFSRWLLSRSPEELIITVTPHRMYSWDYRERMAEVSPQS